ncbi:hypothetical protein, partial [Flavobacterium sp. NKUCC04_CG]|uniref:hypothetical protein n=1 Tax=Flavobacterium sp. NKUCC04_CG TaxID=2842121 RepID=UPI001C5B4566
ISRMMSPLRGWFGDLFENNGIPQGVENVYRNTMSIITAITISRMMSPLRGWFGDLFENNGIPQGVENV